MQDLIVAELKTSADKLRAELEATKGELASSKVEVADLQLANQMKHEQLTELETQVENLRGESFWDSFQSK